MWLFQLTQVLFIQSHFKILLLPIKKHDCIVVLSFLSALFKFKLLTQIQSNKFCSKYNEQSNDMSVRH
jgi:hypothetical protein